MHFKFARALLSKCISFPVSVKILIKDYLQFACLEFPLLYVSSFLFHRHENVLCKISRETTRLCTRALDRRKAVTLVFSRLLLSNTFESCHPNHRGANTFPSTEDSEEHNASVCLQNTFHRDRHEGNSVRNRPPKRIHLSEEWNKQVHIKKQNPNFHSIHFIFLSLIISVHINGKNMFSWLQSKTLVLAGDNQQ